MVCMTEEVFNQMAARLEVLKNRMVNLIEFDMSHDECIELVAPAEHVPVLKNASKYADISASENWMELHVPARCDGELDAKVMLYMRTHGEKEPPLRPRTPEWQPNRGGGQKVINWLDKRLAIGRRFGLANKVLSELSGLCDTGAQIRYLWPVVMHLTRGTSNERTIKWAERNAAYKAQRHTPAISMGLREAIRDSAALLTSATLLGDDVPDRPEGEVKIETWTMPWFDFRSSKVLRR